jgi:hypothetical protein
VRDVGRGAPGVAAGWSILALVLFVVQRVSFADLSAQPALVGSAWSMLAGWEQFDGHQYVGIAAHGYWFDPSLPSNIVWFPGYPLSIRWIGTVVGDHRVAAFGVSALGGLAAAVLLWRWLGLQRLEGGTRMVALGTLFLSPYAFFLYGAIYSDALFLALVVAAFLCVERDRFLLAGLIGALATVTRPTGLCLVPALALLALERSRVLRPAGRPGSFPSRWRLPLRFDRSALRPAHLAPLLSLAGVGTYVVWLGVRFGAPLAFVTNEEHYHPAAQDWRHEEWFHQLSQWAARGWSEPRYPLSVLLQALLVLAVIASAPFVGRRFGWGYGLFCALLGLIPFWSVGDFFGSGRYLLAAFPAYALLGERLSRFRRSSWVVLGCSAVVMVWLSAGLARGWYLT